MILHCKHVTGDELPMMMMMMMTTTTTTTTITATRTIVFVYSGSESQCFTECIIIFIMKLHDFQV